MLSHERVEKGEIQLPIHLAEDIIWPDGAEVVGHDERGGQHGPEGHLGLRLVVTQREITNYELKIEII